MGNCCTVDNRDPTQVPNVDYEKIKEQIIDEKWPELAPKIKKTLGKLTEFKWEEPNTELNTFPIYRLTNSSQQGEWDKLDIYKRHGRCQELEADGSQQIGQYHQNKRNGKGRLINPNGDCQEGDFKDGEAQGQGTFIREDGMTFEGIFEGFGQKQLNGKGKQTSSDKTVQEGEFKAGHEHGIGKVFLTDGSIFEGSFENKEMTHGTLEWPDKTKQIGQFEKKKFHGQGKQIQPDGKIFEGTQVNGIKQGPGLMISKDGFEIRGNWVNGNLEGKAQMKKGDQEWELVQKEGKKVSKKRTKKKETTINIIGNNAEGEITPISNMRSPQDKKSHKGIDCNTATPTNFQFSLKLLSLEKDNKEENQK